MDANRANAAVDFLLRVFSVPVPDAATSFWLNPEQRAPNGHSDGLHQLEASLARGTRRKRRGCERADQMRAIEPIPLRNSGRVGQHIGRGTNHPPLLLLLCPPPLLPIAAIAASAPLPSVSHRLPENGAAGRRAPLCERR